MKKYLYRIFVLCLTFSFCLSCSKEDVQKLIDGDSETIVKGLKSALEVGVDNSVKKLSAENGYLADSAVKILLPQEAQTAFDVIKILSKNAMTKTILTTLDINADFENTLVTLVNRAAEDAAPKATNIFVTAITDMTISDGKDILFGANNAATDYLSQKTYTGLQAAFNPSITASLNTVEVGSYTPMTAWAFFAEQNNTLADLIESKQTIINAASVLGLSKEYVTKIQSVKHISTNLPDYVTGKALDGLFAKITEEEYKIRTDVNARINSLLLDVFGRLDE